MKTLVLTASLLLLAATTAMSEDKPVTVKPAINTPAAAEKAGVRPYEMIGRKDVRVPLVDFQDLAGWTVECYNGANAELALSREQRMWGEYTGKLTYTGKSDDGTVILRLPKPIPIDSFDCVNMWLHGNLWERAPEPGTPFVNVSVIVVDPAGKEQALPPTRVRWKEWWLTHAKLGEPMTSAKLAGIKIEGINNPEPRSIYFGALYLYSEQLKALTFAPRPARNFTPLPGQDQGLNGTGPGRLPFPTREQTILPSNSTKDFSTSTRATTDGTYEFVYKGKDGEVKYVYQPSTGKLGEITTWVNGKRFGTPMNAGGIEIGGAVVDGKLIETKLDRDELHVVFDLEKDKRPVRAEYVLRIWQKSLVIDFICRGGRATGLALGDIEGVAKPRLLTIPFVCFNWQGKPRILCSGEVDQPVFASVWVDWYRSNGSELWTEQWSKEGSAKINGGVRYSPKTDGQRNDLYERVFLTVAPTFEEVLPTIDNPPSARGKVAGERLWQETWGPNDYAKEIERGRKLRSHGIEKLTQCNR